MNSKQHNETRLQGSTVATTRLQTLTPTEMHEIHGGGRPTVPDDPKPATCWENASKSEEYPVLFEVPC